MGRQRVKCLIMDYWGPLRLVKDFEGLFGIVSLGAHGSPMTMDFSFVFQARRTTCIIDC